MFRTSASRSALRPLSATSSPAPRCAASSLAKAALRNTTSLTKHVKPRAITAFRKDLNHITRGVTGLAPRKTPYPGTFQDKDFEKKISERVMNAHPERVSATSTIHPMFGGEVATKDQEDDVDMMKDIRHDLRMIKETMALQDVPTDAFRLGMAGVLPYLATASATLFSAIEYNNAVNGASLVLSEQTAEAVLDILEPLEVGYGAVILSFLGAIHWGMEWARFGGGSGMRRYAIGVLAPAMAWPTLMLPVETALITQFVAFNILYYIDVEATEHGWVPGWYGSYRFVLTLIVGISIVISLIGRGLVMDREDRRARAELRLKFEADQAKKDRKRRKAAADDE